MDEFTELKYCFTTHAAALVLYARQWCPSPSDAEDVVQEAFIQYWQHRHAAKDPAAYLYSAVRSRSLDLHRGQRRRIARETSAAQSEHSSDAEPLFLSIAEQTEFAAIIQAQLRTLPTEQSEVLILKIWAELSFAQIGQVLAIPLNTAASRYRYAIESLRKQFTQVMP